jgi:putative oxidoreductase
MRVKEPRLAAYLVGMAELAGGFLLALGLLTPLGCAAILAVMLGAIFLAHWPNLWVTEGGFEYPLVNVAVVTFYGLVGPGGWSLDEALGTQDVLAVPWTYIIAAAVAIVAVAGMLVSREPSYKRWQRPANDGGGRFASQGR